MNEKFTTLAILFLHAIKANGGDFATAVYDKGTAVRLDHCFEAGHGSSFENEKYAGAKCWCGDRVYITTEFDGKVEVVSALRNPPTD